MGGTSTWTVTIRNIPFKLGWWLGVPPWLVGNLHMRNEMIWRWYEEDPNTIAFNTSPMTWIKTGIPRFQDTSRISSKACSFRYSYIYIYVYKLFELGRFLIQKTKQVEWCLGLASSNSQRFFPEHLAGPLLLKQRPSHFGKTWGTNGITDAFTSWSHQPCQKKVICCRLLHMTWPEMSISPMVILNRSNQITNSDIWFLNNSSP